MFFLSVSPKKSKCFGGLVQLYSDKNSKKMKLNLNLPQESMLLGMEILQKLKKPSECGKSALQNFFYLPYSPCELKGLSGIFNYLEKLGYVSGLTYQPVPYDFRKSSFYAETNYTIERSIKTLFQLTGKKVAVVAHSLGNIYSMNFFNNISQEFKDEKILNYVAVAPPFVGSSKSLNVEIGGDKKLFYFDTFGLNYEGQKGFLGSTTGLYSAFPTNSYFEFQNEEWMKSLIQRIQNEKNFPVETKEGKEFWKNNKENLNWYPSPIEKCANGKVGIRDEFCKINMIDMRENPILTVENKKYFAKSEHIEDLISKYLKFSNKSIELYRDANQNDLNLLINPNVPISIVFGSYSLTDYEIIYENDPAKIVEKTNNFCFPDKILKVPGDKNNSYNFFYISCRKMVMGIFAEFEGK